MHHRMEKLHPSLQTRLDPPTKCHLAKIFKIYLKFTVIVFFDIVGSTFIATSNPVCQDAITISRNTYSESNDNIYDLCFLIKLYCSFIDRKFTRCNEDCILH
jgi:hypothetical protein